MKFDNAQFEKNCAQSMSTLDKLKSKINEMRTASSLKNLGDASKDLALEQMDKSLESINKKFSVLGVVGATVISELTKSAMEFAHKVTTAIPNIIKEGGWTRAMNIEQAKFQLEGLGIAWSKVGEQISNAVSGTAYSMDSAAKAASQLAASGVEISGVGDQMERTLKAISGVAAQTNSSYDEISNIFTTVAGNGRLMGDQLRQLSYRGMNAAAVLAKAFDTTEAEIREMVSHGEISFEAFSEIMYETFAENAFKANQTFTGSLDNMKAALKRTGEAFAGPVIRQTIPVFNALREAVNKANKEVFKFSSNNVTEQSKIEERIKSIQETMEEYDDALKKGEITLQEYNEKTTFLNNSLREEEQALVDCYGPFEKLAYGIQKEIVDVIKKIDFDFMYSIMEGLINLSKTAYSVVKPLGQALLDVFGITTRGLNASLDQFAYKFEKFTRALILSTSEMNDLKRIFRGVISVLSLGKYILASILKVILGVDVSTNNLRSTILKILGVFGDVLYLVIEGIKEFDLLGALLMGIRTVLEVIVGLVVGLGTAIYNTIKYVKSLEIFQTILNGAKTVLMYIVAAVVLLASKIAYVFSELKKGNLSVLGPLEKVIVLIKNGIMLIIGAIGSVVNYIKNLSVVSGVVDKVTAAFDKLKKVVYAIFGKKVDDGVVTITDDDVPKGLGDIAAATDTATRAIDGADKTFSGFSTTLTKFKDDLTLSRVAAIAFTVSILLICYKVADALQGLGKGVKGIGSFMGQFAKRGLVGMILGTGDRTRNKFLDTAIAIGILAASLVAIANVPADKLKVSAESLVQLITGYAAMMTLLTVLDNNTRTLGGINSVTTALVKLTAAISGMAIALWIFSRIDGDVTKGMQFMVGLGVELVAMAIALAKYAKDFAVASGSMIGLALSIDILSLAFRRIVQLEYDLKGAVPKIVEFAAFTAALVAMASFCARLGGNSSFLMLSSSILMLSVAMGIVVTVLQKLNIQRVSNLLDKWAEFFRNNVPYFALSIAIGVASIVATIFLIKNLPKILDSVFKGIRSVLSKGKTLSEEVSEKVNYIGVALNKVGIALIIATATAAIIALAGLALALSKIKDKQAVQDTIYQIVLPLVGMVSILMMVAKLTEGAKPTAILSSILAIGVILGSIMAIITMYNAYGNDIFIGVGGIAGILIAWGLMLNYMSKIKFDASAYKSLMAAIGGIAIIVGSIYYLINIVKNNKPEDVLLTLGTLAGMMLAFGILVRLLGGKGMSFTKDKHKAIIETVIAVAAIAGGLALIMWVAKDGDTMIKAAESLGGVLIVLGLIAYNMAAMKTDPTLWTTFLGMAIAAFGVAAALALLANVYNGVSTEAIIASVITLNVTAGLFAAMAGILGKFSAESVVGMVVLIGLAVAAIGFAVAIQQIAQFRWEEIKDGLEAMADVVGVAVVLAMLLGAIPEISVIGAAVLLVIAAATEIFALSILTLSAAIAIALPAIQQFIASTLQVLVDNKDNLPEIGKGLLVLAEGLSVLGAAGIILLLGAPGLILGSVGMLATALAFYALGKVDWETITNGMNNFLVPALKFALAEVILASCSKAIITASSALLIYALAVNAAEKLMTDHMAEDLAKLPQQMYEIGRWIPKSVMLGMQTSAPALIVYASTMAKNLEEAIRNVLGIHSNSLLFNDIGKYIPSSLGVGIDKGMPGLESLVGSDMASLVGDFDLSASAESAGYNTIVGFENGINNEGVWSKIKTKFSAFFDWINSGSTWSDVINSEADKTAKKKKNFGVRDNDVVKNVNEAKKEQLALKKAMNDTSEAAEEEKSWLDDLTKGLGEAGGASKSAAESTLDLSSAFQNVDRSSKISLKDMTNNLVSNLKENYKWAKDIKLLLTKGYDSAITEWVQSM